jgi:hypothetical protein
VPNTDRQVRTLLLNPTFGTKSLGTRLCTAARLFIFELTSVFTFNYVGI